MALPNPLWGAPRIHGELLKLGLDVSQRTVARLMPCHPKLPSPSWRTFLQNHLADLVSVAFFVVPATFRVHSTCSWSYCIIGGKSCTSTSRTRPLPPGRRNKLSKLSPMTWRRCGAKRRRMHACADGCVAQPRLGLLRGYRRETASPSTD